MMRVLKKALFGFLGLLILVNLIFFIHSISLASEINTFEQEIKKIHRDNLLLEKKIYQTDSLRYAASIAAQLDFTSPSAPIYIKNDVYALNR